MQGLPCRGTQQQAEHQRVPMHALQAASQNLTVAAARYGAARSALGLLGPLMWAWLGADLALKALGTDYGRLVRAIFALCQIRLLRTHGFVNPT